LEQLSKQFESKSYGSKRHTDGVVESCAAAKKVEQDGKRAGSR